MVIKLNWFQKKKFRFTFDFNKHINNKINKCNKPIGVMKELSLTLSRETLFTIYKSFVRPNLDYADIIYNKPFNESFKNKLETVQYCAALNISWSIVPKKSAGNNFILHAV